MARELINTLFVKDEKLVDSAGRRITLAERGRFVEKQDGSIKSRFLFMCCSDQHRSHLEHVTDHNDFTRNGVHYVGWLDVLCNISARPAVVDVKMLMIIMVSILSTDIVVNERSSTWLDEGINKDVISYLTFGLALLLVFRVGQSYGRYNDARVKWGMMVNRTRDLSRQFFCYVSDPALAVAANKWIIAYVFACKQSLRWKKECPELVHTLEPAELARLNQANHMPIYCMEQISNCIREALRKGHIDTMQVKMMDENITGFEDYIGASERLLKTPVPFGLVLHLRWVMIFYICTVPFYLAGPGGLHWGAVPVTVIFAYSLTGLEDISQAIENPFRQSWHCLPIDGICNAIKANLLEIEARHVGINTNTAPQTLEASSV